MEKRLLLFLVLTFGIIWVYYTVFPPPPPQEPAEPPAKEAPATGTGGESPGEPAGPGEPVEPGGEPSGPDSEVPEAAKPGAGRRIGIDTPLVAWQVDTWGGSIREARLKRFAREPGLDLGERDSWQPAIAPILEPAVDPDAPAADRGGRALAMDVLDAEGEIAIEASKLLWEVAESDTDHVLFRLGLPWAGAVLEKELTFAKEADGVEGGAYHAEVELRLRVTDAAKAKRYGAEGWRVRLTGGGGMPFEPNTPAGMGTVAAVLTTDKVSPEELDPGDAPTVWPEREEQGSGKLVSWAGLHSRFFAVILKAEHPGRVAAWQAVLEEVTVYAPKEAGGEKVPSLSAAIDFTMPFPKDGEAATARSFLFYAGPMDPDVFEAPLYADFDSIIDYGFFGGIAKILVFLLGVFHSVLGNWGVAIILLTLMIRVAMFPLSRKQQMSMQRYSKQMARLKPKMDALKERHAKNKKKLNEEMMKLYREEGVRMFPAGCLVMFLQLPIFIGLFQALRYSIGLRHSSFLWVKDLTAPDQLAHLGGGFFLVPEYLNLLPILMGFTWWLSTALQPKPADPQQAQTMKMMQWMPVVFSIFLYSYPAGLALYMVVSSSWSIFETKVVKKILFKEDQTVAAGPAPTFRKGK